MVLTPDDSGCSDGLNDDSLNDIARRIIDRGRYMTLGTCDEKGEPWASPVFYSTDGYGSFYWMSSPDATHSKNLKPRPNLAIVIFDTADPVGACQAVYVRARAEELPPPRD